MNTLRAETSNLRHFLAWLESHDAERRVCRPSDLNSEITANYLRYVSGIPGKQSTRAAIWNFFRRLVERMISENVGRETGPPENVLLPSNPFPLTYRTMEPAAPLTVEEVAALLRQCRTEMEAVWRKFEESGESWAGPSVPDLLPFMFAAALFTGFNPDTLRGLRIGDIRPEDAGRLVVRGDKPRAGKQQQAVFIDDGDDALSPWQVLKRALEITDVLRATPAEIRDFLWLAASAAPTSVGRVMALGAAPTVNLTRHIRLFARRAGIEDLSLRRMRATAAELLRLLDGGISVSAVLGNSAEVAARHYKSAGAARREQIGLARQMEIRVRFVRSGGRRDVRDGHLRPQSAATPGYICADPFNPPIDLAQAPGMCAAFLACPTCPQAGFIIDSAEAVADLLALRAALDTARGTVAPIRWRTVCRPASEAIDAVLERVTPAIPKKAARIPVRPLPEIE